jgi:hypothetical protein
VHLVHYTPAAQEINQTTIPRRLEIQQLRILEMDQREITQIQQQTSADLIADSVGGFPGLMPLNQDSVPMIISGFA